MTKRSSIWLSLTLAERGNRVTQLCRVLRAAIQKGQLGPGERLPSSRQLATDLGCSRTTVEAAYQRLTTQGYLTRHLGQGSFVTQRGLALSSPTYQGLPPTLSNRGQQLLAQSQCLDPRTIQPFSAGVPDVNAFPLHQWAEVTRRVMESLAPEQLLYGDPQGLAECRKAISHYLALSRQVNCSPSQIIVINSSQQGLQWLAHILLDEGETVVTEALCYPGAVNAFRQAGAVLAPQPMDQDGAIPPTHHAKLAYLTPGHHYPLGMTMSESRRQQWLDWATRHQSWIIEDDYDGEYHYRNDPPASLQRLDRGQKVIYLGTFSKTLFPSIRLAYMVVPPALVPQLASARQRLDSHTAVLSQAVVAAFISEGYFASHLRLMKKLYAARRALLIELLKECPADTVRLLPSEGGLQLAIEYLRRSTSAITAAASHKGHVLAELAPLCLITPVINGWILGFAALTPQAIRQAVTLLNEVLQSATSLD
ncbi:PLP-dependent aminotransferase family protein [Rosenbergiella epipactidis]|uniref:MocR-like pyridoxine biosynthesis transcription factor PdxR n=1 Tax=Rosenbergiella epipactidis TaxID=1544694 RepID=UPI001BDAF96B|nr:PLP-dependent aminotransferase family protein [Rosenbergiella epipactidis]MBT0718026.1 PLP-dependent aminotransferase family protein [Rosenbergiella epipactidis]